MEIDDTEILRLERAAIKGHTGKVLIMGPNSEGAPFPVPALRTRVGKRMGTFPRLVQRVEEPRLGLGHPVWAPVDYLDLHWHVADPYHADPLSDEEFRLAVGELLSERLDHTRPLWRIDALPLTGGRTGLIARIHHAMADGISAIRLASGLLWDQDDDAPQPVRRDDVKQRSGAKPAEPTKTQRAGSEGRDARILVRLPAALWRELRPAANSELDYHIGPAREVAWITFSLERLK